MQEALVFAGFGGQGVMFAGQLLAYAAMAEGLEVTWIPSYGPEMRGGTAHCYVVLSEKVIGSPMVRHPQIGVVLNKPSFEKYESVVAPGGWLAINSTLIDHKSQRTDINQLIIPATQLADKAGDVHTANVVMIGALLTVHPMLPLDAIRQALELHVPAQHQYKLPINFKALEMGAALGDTHRIKMEGKYK